jgi:phosphatidyl-myo-inositol dimannoside synthase
MRRREYRSAPQVLVIARTLPPRVGGIQQLAQNLSEQLRAQIGARTIGFRHTQYLLPLFYTKALIQIIAEALLDRVDVLYLTDCASAPFAYLVKRLTGIPYVTTANGRDVTFRNTLYRWLLRPALANAARVVAVSRAIREECLKRGADPERCVVIPNGINPSVFAHLSADPPDCSPQRPRILLSVGRLIAVKGYHLFVRSILPEVVRLLPDVQYWLVGDGPMRRAIQEEARHAKVDDHVRFIGQVPMNSSALWNLYQKSDLVVMPGVEAQGEFEGFGIVALEAATCGKLVVAYAQHGVTDAVVQGQTGYLIPPNNPERFIEQTVALLESRKDLPALGQRAREYVLGHSCWHKIAGRYVEVLASAVAESRANRKA